MYRTFFLMKGSNALSFLLEISDSKMLKTFLVVENVFHNF